MGRNELNKCFNLLKRDVEKLQLLQKSYLFNHLHELLIMMNCETDYIHIRLICPCHIENYLLA